MLNSRVFIGRYCLIVVVVVYDGKPLTRVYIFFKIREIKVRKAIE